MRQSFQPINFNEKQGIPTIPENQSKLNVRSVLLFVFFFVSLANILAQSIFQKIFKSPNETRGYFAEQTTDGGFIIAGGAFVVRTDTSGHLLWFKGYFGPYLKCVHQTSDGGFILAGYIYQGNPNYYDGFVMKTDSMGNVHWSNTFGESNYELFDYVEETADGGYILSGVSADSSIKYQLSLVKIDGTGNQLWSKCFRHSLENKVRQTQDGGYIIAGTTNVGCNTDNGSLVKIDSFGNLLWTKDYCDTNIEEFSFTDVQQTTDGGYIISGSARVPQTVSSTHLLLIKTDAAGGITWQKAYYGNPYGESHFYAVQQTSDGGYVGSGWSSDFGPSYSDAILVKTDTAGDILWSKVYGTTTGVHQARSVSQTSDGGYVLAGHIIPPGAGGMDKYFYLIKTDSIGNSGCLEADVYPVTWQPTMQDVMALSIDTTGENSFPLVLNVISFGTEYDFCTFVSLPEYLSNTNIISLYPNPTITKFTISIAETVCSASIKIFNAFGEEVYSEHFSGRDKEIDYDLHPGIYFIEITEGKNRWTEKIIKD